MTFFNFSPKTGGQGETPQVADNFWIYWAVTAPITIVVVIAWLLWQVAVSRKARQLHPLLDELPLDKSERDLELNRMSL